MSIFFMNSVDTYIAITNHKLSFWLLSKDKYESYFTQIETFSTHPVVEVFTSNQLKWIKSDKSIQQFKCTLFTLHTLSKASTQMHTLTAPHPTKAFQSTWTNKNEQLQNEQGCNNKINYIRAY